MKTHTLFRKQILPIDLQTAWDFFSSPKNLAFITPRWMNFRIVAQSGGETMHAGQIIHYKVTVLPMIRVTWVTEITSVQGLVSFTDEQRKGPYSRWHHRHTFTEVSGGVEMTDEVNYGLPFGPIGQLANLLFVERQVRRIFDYRFKILKAQFPQQ